jgi:hypothetical protein
MRRFLFFSAFFATAAGVWACGDKLMLVMGVRSSQVRPVRAASILAYSPGNSPSSVLIRQIQMQPALIKAGHKIQTAEDPAGLDSALRSGKYDVVLADVAVADELGQRLQSATSHPVVLPVAYKVSKAEQSLAQKKFHCLLKGPGDTEHYLAAIDQAMEWKARAISR